MCRFISSSLSNRGVHRPAPLSLFISADTKTVPLLLVGGSRRIMIFDRPAIRRSRGRARTGPHDRIMRGDKIIKRRAFYGAYEYREHARLTSVKILDVEEIEEQAFFECFKFSSIKLPDIRIVGVGAFGRCYNLSYVELGDKLEIVERVAFDDCQKLERIALPLKGNMIKDYAFLDCPMLTTVDLVEGIHQTIASLHLENWRSELNNEINRINQILPTTETSRKTTEIQQWMEEAISQLNYYKEEHRKLLREATTLLELALWKANLSGNEGKIEGVRITRGRHKRARKEIYVTTGADVVIKNVLPFLALK